MNISADARSLLGRPWQLSLTPEVWRQASALAQSCGLPLVVAQLLISRGYTQLPIINNFLNPRLDQLPDPTSLKDCTQAASLLANAIQNQQKIAIFGDYDVDGTCATALVTHYLRALGIQPIIYIPDRLTEGYGPNEAAMETLAKQGAQLLLTVDTGTCAPGPLNRAAALGLTVVVTDHHQPDSQNPADLPLYGNPKAALVNPHRPDDTSGLGVLCGSGVAFFVLMELNRQLRQSGFFNASRSEPRLTRWLDLVALATVADVMSLTGVNRILVARGLQQLGTWQNRGLAALASVAGVKGELTATTLGFQFGPRLNAAGRIDSARAALDLLLADDDALANRYATLLDKLNQQRRQVEQTVLAEAMAQAEQLVLDDEPILVLHGAGWHPGVVGIVASRVKERFNRPVFILGQSDDAEDGTEPLLKGSGRGLAGLNLGDAVHACQSLLVSGGGHAMAAGLSLHPQQLASFCQKLKENMWQQIENSPLFNHPSIAALPLSLRLQTPLLLDAVLTPSGATPQLVQALSQLEPYGTGHPEPMLALTGCTVSYCKAIGAGAEHLKMTLSDARGARLDAICFGVANTPLGDFLATTAGKPITVAGHLRSRQFNGRTYIDFQIKDAHATWQAPTQLAAA